MIACGSASSGQGWLEVAAAAVCKKNVRMQLTMCLTLMRDRFVYGIMVYLPFYP